MKLIQQLFLPLLLFFINISVAQTTAIPDENFEQALIDMNIDSDGTINEQVLTADIENIVVLDFGNLSSFETIFDLTGIEDFVALEVLDFAEQGVYLYDSSNADIFSNNINLRELYMKNQCGDCGGVALQILDLSGLPNLELVDLTNVYFNILKINNSNFDIENLTLDLYHEGPPSNDWSQQICIEVADPQAATNNQPPYDTWNIITNSKVTYFFDSNCVLSVDDFENLNSLSIYPNPVQEKLNIQNPQQISLDKIDVFDMTGKKVKSFSSFDDSINVESLEQGVYFIKVMSENRTKTFKVMKK